MKIRLGFVSNSSSSSFVVHKSEIGDENFNRLIEELEKFRDGTILPYKQYEKGWLWGDEYTFFVKNNYIVYETFYITNEDFFKMIKDCGVTEDNALSLCEIY